MKRNPLQFAITREDPQLEIDVLKKMNSADKVLLVCSAGDTVLALREAFPKLQITAFDFNPTQLQHLQNKIEAPSEGLNQKGNFESLFRQWRRFFNEFILDPEETISMFEGKTEKIEECLKSPYWQVSFDLHFHDSFLRAMFGEAAIQHAPKGSYPDYFRRVFEKGLLAKDFASNPFLQHIFLGSFTTIPSYLKSKAKIDDINLICGNIFDIPSVESFDLIQLSNIFDWSNEIEIKATCAYLGDRMKPNSKILIRQINSEVSMEHHLGPRFKLEKEYSEELLRKDRSLFYSSITLAEKIHT